MSKADIKSIRGIVKFCGKNNDGKNTASIIITQEQADKLTKSLKLLGIEDGISATPIKITDDGEILFKAISKYNVPIFENGIEQIPEDESSIKIKGIGQDSEVQLSFILKEVPYRRQKYQVAYLQSINVLDLVPFETFNAFADSDVEEF